MPVLSYPVKRSQPERWSKMVAFCLTGCTRPVFLSYASCCEASVLPLIPVNSPSLGSSCCETIQLLLNHTLCFPLVAAYGRTAKGIKSGLRCIRIECGFRIFAFRHSISDIKLLFFLMAQSSIASCWFISKTYLYVYICDFQSTICAFYCSSVQYVSNGRDIVYRLFGTIFFP